MSMIEKGVNSPENKASSMLKIAVADDEPAILKVFYRLAQAVAAEKIAVIDQYNSGDEVVNAVIENPTKYNLVLTDGQMGPGKNGVEVARELKVILPVYLSSAGMPNFDIDDSKLVKEAGFSGTLKKPYSIGDVRTFLAFARVKIAQVVEI